jgi:hypothetical protein
MKPTVSMYRHITSPRRQIKTAARTDFTSKYGLPLSEKNEKIFWQGLSGKLHFRQKILAKLCF